MRWKSQRSAKTNSSGNSLTRFSFHAFSSVKQRVERAGGMKRGREYYSSEGRISIVLEVTASHIEVCSRRLHLLHLFHSNFCVFHFFIYFLSTHDSCISCASWHSFAFFLLFSISLLQPCPKRENVLFMIHLPYFSTAIHYELWVIHLLEILLFSVLLSFLDYSEQHTVESDHLPVSIVIISNCCRCNPSLRTLLPLLLLALCPSFCCNPLP